MKKHKILIADDDRDYLQMLAFICRKEGYEVVLAANAEKALQIAVESDPDLIMLDVHLGDDDSYGVKERLQNLENPTIAPVIFLTGDPSKMVECMAGALNVRGVIRKPFRTDELLAMIAQLVIERETANTCLAMYRRHAAARAIYPTEIGTDELSNTSHDSDNEGSSRLWHSR